MSSLMNLFYRDTFERFTERWVKGKHNIMEFNQFLDDIYGMELKKNIPFLLAQHNQS